MNLPDDSWILVPSCYFVTVTEARLDFGHRISCQSDSRPTSFVGGPSSDQAVETLDGDDDGR